MLQGAKLTNEYGPNDYYPIFSVVSFHLLHLGISVKLEACATVRILSQRNETGSSFPKKYCRTLSSWKQQI